MPRPGPAKGATNAEVDAVKGATVNAGVGATMNAGVGASGAAAEEEVKEEGRRAVVKAVSDFKDGG